MRFTWNNGCGSMWAAPAVPANRLPPLRRQRLLLGAGMALSVAVHGAALHWLPGLQRPPSTMPPVPAALQIALEVPRPAPAREPQRVRPEPQRRAPPQATRVVAAVAPQPESTDPAAMTEAPQIPANPASAPNIAAAEAAAAPRMPATPQTHAAQTPPVSAPEYRAAYLENPQPPYPISARRRGLEGTVVLRVEVLANGSCGRLEVKNGSGHEILDSAAAQAVKSWRFAPARRGGDALAAWVEIPVTFRLKDLKD